MENCHFCFKIWVGEGGGEEEGGNNGRGKIYHHNFQFPAIMNDILSSHSCITIMAF